MNKKIAKMKIEDFDKDMNALMKKHGVRSFFYVCRTHEHTEHWRIINCSTSIMTWAIHQMKLVLKEMDKENKNKIHSL